MSIYSQAVKTRDLDPNTFVQGSQVRFRFPKGTYFPNIRVAGLNMTSSGNHIVNIMAGVYAQIKNIRLTSSGMELDALQQAHRYLAFTQLNNKNEDNVNVEQNQAHNGLGFVYKALSARKGFQVDPRNTTTLGATFDDGASGILDVRKCLPLLESISVLDTDIFPNLELTIEFETNSEILTRTLGDGVTVARPILIVDQVDDPAMADKMKRDFKGVVWNKIEHDSFNVPFVDTSGFADTDKATQSVNQRIERFSDKYVGRIVASKMFTNPDIAKARTTGYLGSLAVHGEAFNIRVDGAKVFPTDISRESTRLCMLTDTFGAIGLPPYGDRETVGLDTPQNNSVNINGVNTLAGGNRQGNLVGSMSYIGFALNSPVRELQMDFSRVNIANDRNNNAAASEAPESAPITVHLHGEVRKSISMNKDGSFRVGYI